MEEAGATFKDASVVLTHGGEREFREGIKGGVNGFRLFQRGNWKKNKRQKGNLTHFICTRD